MKVKVQQKCLNKKTTKQRKITASHSDILYNIHDRFTIELRHLWTCTFFPLQMISQCILGRPFSNQ